MITTWSKGPASDNMPEEILVEVLETVRRHPWWIARARFALAILRKYGVAAPSRVLDAGCGWGTNLVALEKARYIVTGLDISRDVLERIDSAGRRLIEADLTCPLPEEAQKERFDALLALDVIEHIDDDRGAVRRTAELLKPGGIAVFSVPALPELYSEFDAIQGHRRRYDPGTFRATFEDTGLLIKEIFWWGAWMAPVLRGMRRKKAPSGAGAGAAKTYADYLRLPPWPGPLLMTLAYKLEQSRALKARLRTGTSLFAVVKRGYTTAPDLQQ